MTREREERKREKRGNLQKGGGEGLVSNKSHDGKMEGKGGEKEGRGKGTT